MNTTQKPPRHGFTLVEMLAVVVIIAILAALITAAAIAARRRAKIAVVGMEINQLDMALKAYKEKFGDYPPDFWGVNHPTDATIRDNARTAVIRHLRKAFPRYTPGVPSGTTGTPWQRLQGDICSAPGTFNIDNLDPAAAMVFCLGGLPEAAGSTNLIGFSANPTDPFDPGEDQDRNWDLTPAEDLNGNNIIDRGSRLPLLFEFDQTRLVDLNSNNVITYHPATGGSNAPYVYFRPRLVLGRQEYGMLNSTPVFVIANYGNCIPYLASPAAVRNWNNPRSFQIISAGMDGIYYNGTSPLNYRDTQSGTNFSAADYDNQTNFCRGTLEDELP